MEGVLIFDFKDMKRNHLYDKHLIIFAYIVGI